MNHYVNEALRRLVSTRAEHLCEYCLIAIADTFFGGEVDHIISVKHGGATEAENLAYTCQPCNRNKGSDLGAAFSRGRAGIATKMRYIFGIPHQGCQRRRIPNAMPQRQHTS